MKPKQDEIGWEKEKNILGLNTADPRPRQENSKKKYQKNSKNLKNLFPELFLAKTGDEIGREREKKILVSNSVHTRPRQENFKKNSKKIQKI